MELGGGGWSWVELGGGGWSWVELDSHCLVILFNFSILTAATFLLQHT